MITSQFLNDIDNTASQFNRKTVWAILPLLAGLLFSVDAIGQEAMYSKYTQLPIDEKYQVESLAPRLVGGVIEELSEKEKKDVTTRNRAKRTAIAEDKRRVEVLLESGGDLSDPLVVSFFGGYVFPEMTQLGDQSFDRLSNLGNLRADFLKSYLSSKLTGQGRQQFIDTICLPKLKEIYSNNTLHPAARLSAVYLLGLIDAVPGARSPATAPTPAPQGLDALLAILQSAESEPFLKVGAWAGIQRHVEIDAVAGNQIPDPKKTQIKDAAIQLIEGKFPGQDTWESDLSYWMKRRSTQMLGLLKDPNTLPKILEVLNNADHGLWLRIDALEAIEKLGLSAVEGPVIDSIGKFLTDSIAAEASWIKNEREELVNENLLFEDVDLEETGTNWDLDPTNPSGGGRGAGRLGGMSGAAGSGGESGQSVDGGGGDRGRGGSRFGAGGGRDRGGPGIAPGGPEGTQANDQKFVELPNYMLNVSRRRIKSVAFIGKQVLKPTAAGRGLHRIANPENQAKIDRTVAPLDKLLKDSNVGIVNLSARRPRPNQVLDEQEAPKKSITDQMIEACENAAKSLEVIFKPKENPAGT